MKQLLAGLLITGGFGLTAAAETETPTSWTCRNEHFEISCYEGTCQNNPEFTPMSVTVSPEEMSVCAYTNCNIGPLTAFVSMGSLQVFMSDQLKSTYPGYEDDAPGEAVITVDVEASSGTIHWAGPYQTPALCEPRNGGTSED